MSNLPRHVAIVMDGNGRWAQKKGLTRLEGHRAGVKSAIDIVRYCGELHIPYLTLYAFSSENWNRPSDEVLGLMGILYDYLSKESDSLVKNGVALRTIGSTERLPNMVRTALERACEQTRGGDRMHLTLALSYGSRDELKRATQKIAQEVLDKRLLVEDITEKTISGFLDTKDLPDPDLLIRTSGEMRLSNFLLWQLSYAELFMTPTLWPDFNRAELDAALADFQGRQRRFGMIN